MDDWVERVGWAPAGHAKAAHADVGLGDGLAQPVTAVAAVAPRFQPGLFAAIELLEHRQAAPQPDLLGGRVDQLERDKSAEAAATGWFDHEMGDYPGAPVNDRTGRVAALPVGAPDPGTDSEYSVGHQPSPVSGPAAVVFATPREICATRPSSTTRSRTGISELMGDRRSTAGRGSRRLDLLMSSPSFDCYFGPNSPLRGRPATGDQDREQAPPGGQLSAAVLLASDGSSGRCPKRWSLCWGR